MSLPDHMMSELKKLVWTLSQMNRVSALSPYSLRVQGKHPVTGGTSVVYHRVRIDSVEELEDLLCALLFGSEGWQKAEFVQRLNKKVTNAYACTLYISGYDVDGDSLDCEVKFNNQEQLLSFVENGVFSIGSARPDMQTLLEYST